MALPLCPSGAAGPVGEPFLLVRNLPREPDEADTNLHLRKCSSAIAWNHSSSDRIHQKEREEKKADSLYLARVRSRRH